MPFIFSLPPCPPIISKNTHAHTHSKFLESQANPRYSSTLLSFTPAMDEYNWRRRHVPAFGSWDCNNEMEFTQCFETARETDLFRYSYSEDRDLYVAGDLYENDVVTPAMIVVPRHTGNAGYTKEKEDKKDGWVVCDYDYEFKAQPSPLSTPPYIHEPKAIDEDLYKISPNDLRAKSKRKRGRGFFSSCLRPIVSVEP